jgi:predicted RNA-binding Zn-ribbon protein involved in translation (DUF1610 family)
MSPDLTTPQDAVLTLWCPWDDLAGLAPGAVCWVCDRVITPAMDGPYNLTCPRCGNLVELGEPCDRCGQAISPTDVWAQARAERI